MKRVFHANFHPGLEYMSSCQLHAGDAVIMGFRMQPKLFF